jgi:predicted HTH domain antitoxin
MQITIELPDDIADRLTQQVGDLSQQTLEALAIECYRSELLSHSEVGRILNLNWWEVEDFLKKANAFLHYDEADLERDRETIIQAIPCN